MLASLAELQKMVRIRLGGEKRCIELTSDDLDVAIKLALDLLTRYAPLEALSPLNSASTAQQRYVIKERLLLGVTHVDFINPQQASDRITENPFISINNNNDGMSSTFGDNAVSEAYLQFSYAQDARRVLSAEPEWQGLWEYNKTNGKREYALYIDLPAGFTAYQVSYRYLCGFEASDAKDRGLPAVPLAYEGWVFEYVTADAMERLGRIRGKFGGIPLPDGGNAETDASRLIDDGRADKERLIEDLVGRQKQSPIIFG